MGLITGTGGIFGALTRTSGTYAVAGALVLASFGGLALYDGRGYFITTAVGIGLLGVSVMLAFYSVKLFKAPDYKDSADHTAGIVLSGDSVQQLETTARPYYICTRCRVLYESGVCHGICLRCDSVTECLKVESKEDIATARSGIGV